jgi:hypothetical protein
MRTQTEISLMGLLDRELTKAKETYALYHHSNQPEKATYYLGKMDGIEASIKVLVIQADN